MNSQGVIVRGRERLMRTEKKKVFEWREDLNFMQNVDENWAYAAILHGGALKC